ncbi:hypothetical protein NXG27_01020 [Megasphaera paucivorans]|uniref:Uncharacterized protein n=1 Tax=Megasphaera paucivorans TaxID=349095 RepID=A0A1G9QDP3_9FIRM|nr:hypothetical protein [Megasphaera paucivorans]SDM09204.1 hypothetical protein SAMN05660299_00205 [Megasphaera paucivorans]
MWILTQDGNIVNLDKSIAVEIHNNEIFSYCGYDSLEHDYLFDMLGKYKDPEKVRDAIYQAIAEGKRTWTMPMDGENNGVK